MLSKPTLSALAALLAAALIIAGCGDSEPALTKAEFIKQADVICKKGEEKKGDAFEAFVLKNKLGPENPITLKQQGEMVTEILLPPIGVEAEEVGELAAPEGEEEKVDAIVDGVEEVVGDLEENPAPFVSKNGDPFGEVADLAQEFGFKQCFVYFSAS